MKFEIIENKDGDMVVVLTKKQSKNPNAFAQLFSVEKVGRNSLGNTLLILRKTANPIDLDP